MASLLVKDYSGLKRITDFFRWWGAGLSFLVPSSFKRMLSNRDDYIRLNYDNNTLRLMDGSTNEIIKEEYFDPESPSAPAIVSSLLKKSKGKSLPCEMLFPISDVLIVSMKVPQETESDIPDMIAYEMDRLTPFDVSQVQSDYSTVEADQDSTSLDVKIVITPRSILDERLDQLDQWGGSPIRVLVEDCEEIDLLPKRYFTSKSGKAYWLNILLILSLLTLLLGSFGKAFYAQLSEIERLKEDISSLSDEVGKVRETKAKIKTILDKTAHIVELKKQSVSALTALNEISEITPKTTWLNRFDFNEGTVTLKGYTQDSSNLVNKIDASLLFEGTGFTSPTLKDRRTGLDQFQLSTQMSLKDSVGSQ
jgi:general secretion pathway protein L